MLKPRVEVRAVDGGLVAEFWDCVRLDPQPVRDLRQRMEEHATNGGGADLIVDLNGVGFAGSAALGGFVAIQRECRARSGRVVFCNVEPTVREVFRVTNLETLFQFAQDLAAARVTLARRNGSESPPEAPAPSATSGRGPLQSRRRPS